MVWPRKSKGRKGKGTRENNVLMGTNVEDDNEDWNDFDMSVMVPNKNKRRRLIASHVDHDDDVATSSHQTSFGRRRR